MKIVMPKNPHAGSIGQTADNIWCYSDERALNLVIHPRDADRSGLSVFRVETKQEYTGAVTPGNLLKTPAGANTKAPPPDSYSTNVMELRPKDTNSNGSETYV